MEKILLAIEAIIVLTLVIEEIIRGDYLPLFVVVAVLTLFFNYIRKKQRAFQNKLEEQKPDKKSEN